MNDNAKEHAHRKFFNKDMIEMVYSFFRDYPSSTILTLTYGSDGGAQRNRIVEELRIAGFLANIGSSDVKSDVSCQKITFYIHICLISV